MEPGLRTGSFSNRFGKPVQRAGSTARAIDFYQIRTRSAGGR